jgi:hypothetical protein
MKKVIITESQKLVIENYLSEAEGDEQKKKSIKDFGIKLAQEFAKAMKTAKINTGVELYCGKTDKDNQVIEESIVSYGTIVANIDNLNHMLVLAVGGVEYTQNGGSAAFEPKMAFGIPFSNPIIVTANSCRLNCLTIANYDPENPNNMKYGRNKLLPDFLGFKLNGDLTVKRLNGQEGATDNGEDTIDADYEDVTNAGQASNTGKVTDTGEAKAERPLSKEETDAVGANEGPIKNRLRKQTGKFVEEWNARTLQLLKSAEFTPGLFFMNNFFFFPKGYAVMDDILAKYGMYVERARTQNNDDDDVSKTKTGRNVAFKLDAEIKDENGEDVFPKKYGLKGINNRRMKYIAYEKAGAHEIVALAYGGAQLAVNKKIKVRAYLIDTIDKFNTDTPLNNNQPFMIDITNIK